MVLLISGGNRDEIFGRKFSAGANCISRKPQLAELSANF